MSYQGNDGARGPLLHPVVDPPIDLGHQLLEVRLRGYDLLIHRVRLDALQRAVVAIHLVLGGLAPLLGRTLDVLGDVFHFGQQLFDGGVLLHPVARPHQGLVLLALPEEPTQLLRLLVDHRASSRRASTNRGRPNRSSCTVTRDHPRRCAKARTTSARRSSISSASSPPASSSAPAPASRAAVAASPSVPLINASRGSNSRTAGSKASYSASVRYGGLDTTTRQSVPARGARRSPSRTSTGTGGRTHATFSRARDAAPADRSTAITRSKGPSTASASAMHPHPVPMSATTPRLPPLPSRLPASPRTSSTTPSVP